MATIQLEGLRKSYGATEIIKGIELTIHDQELTVFVGPSGCGKSTLLRMIAGLEEITAGELLIDGVRMNEIAPAKRGLALVFQSYALYPHMSVAENMAFSLKLAGMPKKEREAKVLKAAHILNLETYLERKPKDLSGGQRQRVAIGRAIVRNPKVFLFDEPLSNLDAALRVRMRLELTKLHKQLHATMVYVTHDQVEAMTMADRIVVLNAGRIEQVGAPMELYHKPRNLFVAGFIGSPRINLLPAVVRQMEADGVTVELPGGLLIKAALLSNAGRVGDSVTVGIRPEHLTLQADSGLPGRVQLVERMGSESYLHVQLSSGEMMIVKVDGETDAAGDKEVRLGVREKFVHLFDGDGKAMRSDGSPTMHTAGREA